MLIDSIEVLKKHLGGVQQILNWQTWEGFVEQAELLHIKPAIGNELYAELVSDLITPTEMEQALLNYLRYATAYYAYLIGMPQLITVMGDAGISVSNPSQAQPMGKWLYVDLKKQMQQKADMWLEKALEYLEQKASRFPTWRNGPHYQTANALLVSTATMLTQYFPFAKGSRQLFLAMMPFLQISEEFFIRPLLGPYFDTLKARLTAQGDELTPSDRTVLHSLRFALAYHAFAQAIPGLNITEDFRLMQETDGVANEDYLSDSRRSELLRNYTLQYEFHSSSLKRYLDENAANLPGYPAPVAGVQKRYERPEADPTKPFYRL